MLTSNATQGRKKMLGIPPRQCVRMRVQNIIWGRSTSTTSRCLDAIPVTAQAGRAFRNDPSDILRPQRRAYSGLVPLASVIKRSADMVQIPVWVPNFQRGDQWEHGPRLARGKAITRWRAGPRQKLLAQQHGGLVDGSGVTIAKSALAMSRSSCFPSCALVLLLLGRSIRKTGQPLGRHSDVPMCLLCAIKGVSFARYGTQHF